MGLNSEIFLSFFLNFGTKELEILEFSSLLLLVDFIIFVIVAQSSQKESQNGVFQPSGNPNFSNIFLFGPDHGVS